MELGEEIIEPAARLASHALPILAGVVSFFA
jgi:hypothetical protein